MTGGTRTQEQLHFTVQHVVDVSNSRRAGMQMALDMGFPNADATKIAVVISELARNILIYAKTGTILVMRHRGLDNRRGLKIIADDHGPGIASVEKALAGGYTTSGGLGLGLSGSKRLMDEFYIHSEVGKGTNITAVKWLP